MAGQVGAAFAAIAFVVSVAAGAGTDTVVVVSVMAFFSVFAPTTGLGLKSPASAICIGLLNAGNIVGFFWLFARLTQVVPIWAAWLVAGVVSMAVFGLEMKLVKKSILR